MTERDWWEGPTPDGASAAPPAPAPGRGGSGWVALGVLVSIAAIPALVLAGHHDSPAAGSSPTAAADTDDGLLRLLPTTSGTSATPSRSARPAPTPGRHPSPSGSPRRSPSPSPSPSRSPSPSPSRSPSPSPAGATPATSGFRPPVSALTSTASCHQDSSGAWVATYTFTVRGVFHEFSWSSGGQQHVTGIEVGSPGSAGVTTHSAEAVVVEGGPAPADGTTYTATISERAGYPGRTDVSRTYFTTDRGHVTGCGPRSPAPQPSDDASPSGG